MTVRKKKEQVFMTELIHEKLKRIKQSFRPLMNGVVAQSMREKGLNYHLNWGVTLTDLQKMAEEYGKDYELAVELWKENIRECKILATLIMPAEQMFPELVDLWMEQTDTTEIAEQACFNLYQQCAVRNPTKEASTSFSTRQKRHWQARTMPSDELPSRAYNVLLNWAMTTCL